MDAAFYLAYVQSNSINFQLICFMIEMRDGENLKIYIVYFTYSLIACII